MYGYFENISSRLGTNYVKELQPLVPFMDNYGRLTNILSYLLNYTICYDHNDFRKSKTICILKYFKHINNGVA